MTSESNFGKAPKSTGRANQNGDVIIVMNPMVSCRNLLKSRGDPPRGGCVYLAPSKPALTENKLSKLLQKVPKTSEFRNNSTLKPQTGFMRAPERASTRSTSKGWINSNAGLIRENNSGNNYQRYVRYALRVTCVT